MRRGEIWTVDLDPARGSESAKRRPAVIVSNDGANTAAARTNREREDAVDSNQSQSATRQ